MSFIEGPFDFVKKFLGSPKSGTLLSGKDEVESHLAQAHDDPKRHDETPNLERLISPPPPNCAFDMTNISRKEVEEVVKKARSKSAPGYSGTSYRVYKSCQNS